MLRHEGEIVVCAGCGNRDDWAGIMQDTSGTQATCLRCGRTVQRGRSDAVTTVTTSDTGSVHITQTVGPGPEQDRGAMARAAASRNLRAAADSLAALAELDLDSESATYAQEATLLRQQANALDRA